MKTRTTTSRTAWHGKWFSHATFSFAAFKNNFPPVNFHVYKTVEVLPLLFTSEYSKENITSPNHVFYKPWKMLISSC